GDCIDRPAGKAGVVDIAPENLHGCEYPSQIAFAKLLHGFKPYAGRRIPDTTRKIETAPENQCHTSSAGRFRPGRHSRKRSTIMIRCNDAITIDRSPADVFAFVADLSNIPRWQAEVVKSIVVTPGPTRVGTHYTEDVKMGPTHVTATCE